MVVKIIFGGQPMVVDLDSFNKEAISFGRSTDCDIQIQKPYVSRCHGYFYRQNGSWFVKDNNSTNGLIYKKQKTQYAPLGSDDIYIVGNDRNDYVTIHMSKSASAVTPKPAMTYGAGASQPVSGYDSVKPKPVGGYQYPAPVNAINQNNYQNPYQAQNQYQNQGQNSFQNQYQSQGQNSFQNQYPAQYNNSNNGYNANSGGGIYDDVIGVYKNNPGYTPGSKECTFDGTGGEIFGLYLLTGFVSLITLGLAFPWAYCKLTKWQYEHTIVRGRRLTFTGTAMQIFGRWCLWALLTVVTGGIFSYFQVYFLNKWALSHICYADSNPGHGQIIQDSAYDADLGDYLGNYLVASLLISITCGIATPWELVRVHKFLKRHMIINGDRFDFHGEGGSFWGQCFLIGLLTVLTCGLYYPWGVCKLQRWFWDNTSVETGYR